MPWFVGSITIYYFVKERTKDTLAPFYPEMHVPAKILFQKVSRQKLCQPSESGFDLGFFDTDDLSKPSVERCFSLVMSAGSCLPSTSMDDQSNYRTVNTFRHAQITQAVVVKSHEDNF